jgi:hypothetical protein
MIGFAPDKFSNGKFSVFNLQILKQGRGVIQLASSGAGSG